MQKAQCVKLIFKPEINLKVEDESLETFDFQISMFVTFRKKTLWCIFDYKPLKNFRQTFCSAVNVEKSRALQIFHQKVFHFSKT